MTDYQLAATELALVHQRAERGLIDVAGFDERSHGLLTLMAMARDSFFARQAGPGSPPWARHGHSGFGYHPRPDRPRPPGRPG
jgi:hypothetical protein